MFLSFRQFIRTRFFFLLNIFTPLLLRLERNGYHDSLGIKIWCKAPGASSLGCLGVQKPCLCYAPLSNRFEANVPLSWVQILIRLPSSDNKFACEISLTDSPNFFNPAFKPNILDPAEIVDFHVMRVSFSIVSRWSEKCAREIIAVTAQLHALGFHTI